MKEYSESELWVCVECGAGFDDDIGGCDSCGGGKLYLKKVSVPMNPFDNTYKLRLKPLSYGDRKCQKII